MPECKEHRIHKLTVHHIIPREEGGTHAMENLITLCEECHIRVHAKKGGPALFRHKLEYPKYLPQMQQQLVGVT